MFLLILEDCELCGSNLAVKLFEKWPTDEDIWDYQKEVEFGMCSTERVIELDELNEGQWENRYDLLTHGCG